MKKSTKVILIVSGVMMASLIILIAILSYFESLQPEEIEYPGSGLSGSIFETQNTSYAANPSFPATHEYKNVPYLLDVPASNKAKVEDGTTYRLNNTLYIYTSEFPFNTDVDYTLSTQLGKILMLDCDDNMTFLETKKEEIGYRNGYGIVYDVKDMYVSNGETSMKAIIMSYYVELPEETEDVLIGVMSTVESNDAIRQMKDVLDAELATFRYDEDQEKNIANRIKEEQREEEAAAYEQEQAEKRAEDELQKAEAAEEEEKKKMLATSDVDITLDEDYIRLNLALSWNTSGAVTEMFLISPNGETYEPEVFGSTRASFNVPNAKAGKWTARVTGTNVGTLNIAMSELGGLDGDSGTTYIEETSSTSTTPSSTEGGTETITEISSTEE